MGAWDEWQDEHDFEFDDEFEMERFEDWGEAPDLTVDGFRWRTMEGEILTLGEVDTKHVFNAMKMIFNHLAAAHGGSPVWFVHLYTDYQARALVEVEPLAALVVFFVEEIEVYELGEDGWRASPTFRAQGVHYGERGPAASAVLCAELSPRRARRVASLDGLKRTARRKGAPTWRRFHPG